ncbi:MAG: hypothetical protein CME71_06140 [Halobacteriovorax sp.]|nr:hypothetical protein [Halobacteriovorax sp.]
MDGKKPLIFIKPYSKTLQKLFEVMEEASEDQGTEIYEIEDLSEAVQLIPQIGQALIIAAHPRKTAQLLQASRVAIKKNQTKVLLLTPKAIPRRAVDKFMKIGLTECIVEPIAPKTLQYKVNLILRSIIIRKEDTDYDAKFGNGTEDDGSKDLQRKTLEAREVQASNQDETEQDQKETSVTDQGPKKSTYKEEAIGGFYKGKITKKEESSEEEAEKKQSPLMQSIESHYKNKLTQSEAENNEKKQRDKVNQEEDDDVEDLAKRVNLLLDEEETEKEKPLQNEAPEKETREQQKKLDIEPEDDFEKAKRELEEDEAEDEIARHHLELIDDASDETEEALSEDEAENAVEKKKKIALEDSEDETDPVSEEEQTEETKTREKKVKLKIEKEVKEASEREKAEKKERSKKERAAKVDLESEDEDSSIDELAQELEEKLRKKRPSLKVEKEAKEAPQREKIEKEAREHKRPTAELDIEDDRNKEKDPVAEKEEREIERKKANKLEVETDLDYGAQKRKDKEKREREKAQSQLEIEDDTKKRESQGYTEKEFNSKSSGYTENIQEKGGNKADAHSDDIDGYYDSRRSLEHGDDEWQEVERERRQKQERSEMRNNEYIVDPEPDLGEQTIDYSDLKKQFSGTSYSLGKKKEIGIFEDDAQSKKPLGFASAIGLNEEDLTQEELEEIEQSAASKEGEICEAKLKSGPALIKALSLYLYHTKDREAVIKGILEILRDDLGVLIALKYGKGPNDGQLKIETIGNWLDQESKDGIINIHKSSADCPIVPAYSDKTFKQKRTTFYYPYTEGITTFAWAQGFFPAGTSEENLRGVEAVLETIRGALLDEFYELGGTGPYAKIEKKKDEKSDTSAASKVKNFFGSLFGKKKAS